MLKENIRKINYLFVCKPLVDDFGGDMLSAVGSASLSASGSNWTTKNKERILGYLGKGEII